MARYVQDDVEENVVRDEVQQKMIVLAGLLFISQTFASVSSVFFENAEHSLPNRPQSGLHVYYRNILFHSNQEEDKTIVNFAFCVQNDPVGEACVKWEKTNQNFNIIVMRDHKPVWQTAYAYSDYKTFAYQPTLNRERLLSYPLPTYSRYDKTQAALEFEPDGAYRVRLTVFRPDGSADWVILDFRSFLYGPRV